MSEREPDTSASTAEFRAFAQSGSSDNAPPWASRASGRRIAIMAVVVIAVTAVLVVAAVLVIKM